MKMNTVSNNNQAFADEEDEVIIPDEVESIRFWAQSEPDVALEELEE